MAHLDTKTLLTIFGATCLAIALGLYLLALVLKHWYLKERKQIEEPRGPVEWIVCRDAQQRLRVLGNLRRSGPEIMAVTPSPSMLMLRPPHRIIVLPGVDLNQKVDEQGLRSLLHSRQCVFGNDAIFIDLNEVV